jgi:hypothetical protein
MGMCATIAKNSSRDSARKKKKNGGFLGFLFLFLTHLFLLGQELVVFDGQLLLESGYLLSKFSDGHYMVRRVGIHHGVTIDHGAKYLGWWTGIFSVSQSNLRNTQRQNNVNQKSQAHNVKSSGKHLGDVRTLWTFVMVTVVAIMMIMVTSTASVLLLLLFRFGRIRMGATLRMLCFGQRPAIG